MSRLPTEVDPGASRENLRDESLLRSPALRLAGLILGLALFAGAIVFIWLQRETVFGALQAVERFSWSHAGLLLLAVLGNIILSGMLFSVLMSRYGRVGAMEMQALIAAATLINFLPLRPGMFGRITYHRVMNGIAVRDSAVVIVQAITLSSIIAAYMALVVIGARFMEHQMIYAIIAPIPLLGAGSFIGPVRTWMLAAFVRYVEVLLWALRYHAAFALLGISLPWHAALALAAVSIVAMLIPFFSNGLGIREWAVGLIAPLLTDTQLELAVTAELLNRAGEILVIGAAGSLGVMELGRRVRKWNAAHG